LKTGKGKPINQDRRVSTEDFTKPVSLVTSSGETLGSTNFEFSIGFNKSPVEPDKLGIVGTPLTGEGPPGPEGIRVGLIPLGEGIVGIFILFFNGDGYIFPSRNAITLEISL
jgi:hypothetical protein